MIKIFMGVLIVCAVPVLFLAAFFLGKDEPEPVAEAEKPEVRKYESQVSEKAEVKEIEEIFDLSLPAETDKTEAIQVAKTFVTAFHSLNPDQPTQYLEEAKPFVTTAFYESYQGIPKRGTLGTRKIEVTHTEAMPMELKEAQQVYMVETTSEVTPDSGEPEMVYDEYVVLLIKEGPQWKVDSVKMNER